MFHRYAIFFTPPPGHLEAFTASWLGWSSLDGKGHAHIDMPGFDIASITQRAQKYGFHATLKAPFRLSDGHTQEDLEAATDAIASTLAPAPITAPGLVDTHGFLALRPQGDVTALNALAAEVTRRFDPFRAALNEAEIARRNPEKLSPRQRQNLNQWGYPYVMEEFGFHMTLSGPISSDVAGVLIAELEPRMMGLLPDPMEVDALTLLGQDQAGMFHQIKRSDLKG